MLRIKSNPAHDHSADPSIVITCYDDLATAITTSSRITLIPDPRSALIGQAATTTGATMGVTVVDMAAVLMVGLQFQDQHSINFRNTSSG